MVVLLAAAADDDDGGADDGGADDGAGAVVELGLRGGRAAPPGQKENVEKDTVVGPAAGPAEPSAMSLAGPLVSWSSACGAMRGHLRTAKRRRQPVTTESNFC